MRNKLEVNQTEGKEKEEKDNQASANEKPPAKVMSSNEIGNKESSEVLEHHQWLQQQC